jgi:hypothetical protein
MDIRCPRNLSNLPIKWCELAVLRLKQIQNSDHILSDEEESKLLGCPWAIMNREANYCFFAFMENNKGVELTDQQIASLFFLNTEMVQKHAEDALVKMRNHETIVEIKETYGNDIIFDYEKKDYLDDYKILK